MKVKELIEMLQQVNPKSEVFLGRSNGVNEVKGIAPFDGAILITYEKEINDKT